MLGNVKENEEMREARRWKRGGGSEEVEGERILKTHIEEYR